MTDIPNTEYITINADGIFVGGKPATHYCGEKIVYPDIVIGIFGDIQRDNPNVQELHVLSSETGGRHAKPGNPSAKHGEHSWCRVKFNDGMVSNWFYHAPQGSTECCAKICAFLCTDDACHFQDFRNVIFSQKPAKVLSVCKQIQRFFNKKSTEFQR